MIWLNSLLALISLLTVFKAPAHPLWYAAIVATEWGHYMAVISGLSALLAWRLARRLTPAVWISAAAAGVFCTPYLRASWVAYDLPAQLTEAFGPATPRGSDSAPNREQPLSLTGLFESIPSPGIVVSQLDYARTGNHTLQMDLYRTNRSTAPLPGVIVIHGGSWKSGDRVELVEFNRYLAARGYLVASIDYRLAPGAVFPAQRQDVSAALTYLKTHARGIGLDAGRFVLVGRSAGGQIALAAAYGLRDPAIKGVVAFYAPSDLVWGYEHPSPRLIMDSCRVLENYLGGTLSQVPETYKAASPVLQVTPTTPPTLMIHGVRDELVSIQHDEHLSRKLRDVGLPYFYLKMPWATHGCDANLKGPCGQLSTYAVERFLAAVMPETSKRRDANDLYSPS